MLYPLHHAQTYVSINDTSWVMSLLNLITRSLRSSMYFRLVLSLLNLITRSLRSSMYFRLEGDTVV